MEDAVRAATDRDGFFCAVWGGAGDADVGDGHRVADAFDSTRDSEVVRCGPKEGSVEVSGCKYEVVGVFGV